MAVGGGRQRLAALPRLHAHESGGLRTIATGRRGAHPRPGRPRARGPRRPAPAARLQQEGRSELWSGGWSEHRCSAGRPHMPTNSLTSIQMKPHPLHLPSRGLPVSWATSFASCTWAWVAACVTGVGGQAVTWTRQTAAAAAAGGAALPRSAAPGRLAALQWLPALGWALGCAVGWAAGLAARHPTAAPALQHSSKEAHPSPARPLGRSTWWLWLWVGGWGRKETSNEASGHSRAHLTPAGRPALAAQTARWGTVGRRSAAEPASKHACAACARSMVCTLMKESEAHPVAQRIEPRHDEMQGAGARWSALQAAGLLRLALCLACIPAALLQSSSDLATHMEQPNRPPA